MKMNKMIRPLFCLALALSIISCIDDKGNYDYKPSNVVTFEGLQTEYTFYYGEPTTIKPEMKQSIPVDESNFSYAWLRMGTDVNYVPVDTIYKGKYIEDQIISLAPRSIPYKMAYVATNNETGVSYMSDYFDMLIIGDISAGFLMLNEVGEKTVLRFFNLKDESLQERIVDLSALGDDLGKPINIVTYGDLNAPYMASNAVDGRYNVSLLTENGLYRLRYNDFYYKDTYNIKYCLMGMIPSDFQIKDHITSFSKGAATATQPNALLKDQNDNYMLYYYAGMDYIMWTPGLVCNKYMKGGVLTEPFKARLILHFGSNLYFDEDSKSWAYKLASGTYCSNYPETDGDFKLNNVDYEPLFAGYKSYDTPANAGVYAIVKKNSGDYQLLAWTHSAGTKRFVRNINNWPGIANIKHFTMAHTRTADINTTYGSLIYYATDSKVYCYHLGYEDVREVYTAPSGNVISFIKIEATTSGAFENKLLVATNSTSGENTSTFEIFNIDSQYGTLTVATLGSGNQTQTLRWTGLPKIVSIDWKAK